MSIGLPGTPLALILAALFRGSEQRALLLVVVPAAIVIGSIAGAAAGRWIHSKNPRQCPARRSWRLILPFLGTFALLLAINLTVAFIYGSIIVLWPNHVMH